MSRENLKVILQKVMLDTTRIILPRSIRTTHTKAKRI